MASPNTQLAIRDSVKIVRPSKIDRTCWHLFRQHVSIDEIATRLNRSLPNVQKSLEKMEVYRALTANEEVNMRYNEIVLENIDAAGKVMRDGLKAVTVTREDYTDAKGKKRSRVISREPDHPTRFKAAELVQKSADRALPKGGGVNVNVQQNNANLNEAAPGKSFADRLRQRREAMGLSNGVVIAARPDSDDDEEDDFEGDDSGE